MDKHTIKKELFKFNFNTDDEIIDYVEIIVSDDLIDDEERKITICDFLLAIDGSDPNTCEQIANAICLENKRLQDLHHENQESHNRATVISLDKIINSETVKESASHIQKSEDDTFWELLSKKEDQCIKKRIVDQYGVQFDDTIQFNEDGQMRSGLGEAGISLKLAVGQSSHPLSDIWANDNKHKVARAAQKQREDAKITSEKEQLKAKLQKLKQMETKDKEKQRVSKKERRTGR